MKTDLLRGMVNKQMNFSSNLSDYTDIDFHNFIKFKPPKRM